jgi:hypothetical protein
MVLMDECASSKFDVYASSATNNKDSMVLHRTSTYVPPTKGVNPMIELSRYRGEEQHHHCVAMFRSILETKSQKEQLQFMTMSRGGTNETKDILPEGIDHNVLQQHIPTSPPTAEKMIAAATQPCFAPNGVHEPQRKHIDKVMNQTAWSIVDDTRRHPSSSMTIFKESLGTHFDQCLTGVHAGFSSKGSTLNPFITVAIINENALKNVGKYGRFDPPFLLSSNSAHERGSLHWHVAAATPAH